MTNNQPSNRQKLTDAERHKHFVETAKKVEASDKINDFDDVFAKLDLKVTGKNRASHRRDGA
jgi:hypothetical protein